MWARVVEFMLACWLGISPFVFRYDSDDTPLWLGTFAAGTAVMVLACLSYWEPTRHAHLATLAVAVAMIVAGRFLPGEASPAPFQNFIYVGILLLMFSIVPNHASHPPRSWRGSLSKSN